MKALTPRPDPGSKAEMIEAALTLFDQSLLLLAQQMPPTLSDARPEAVAPLPSLLEECEMRLDMVVQRRGPRLIHVMPGLAALHPAWWQGRVTGLNCVRLPSDAAGGFGPDIGAQVRPTTGAQMTQATMAGIWQQAEQQGRDLVILAEAGTVVDLGIPVADQVLLAADPWLAFSADRTQTSTLETICWATLRLIEAEPDLPIVVMANDSNMAGDDPASVAAHAALDRLDLAQHWRKPPGVVGRTARPVAKSDADLMALAPTLAKLRARHGIETVAEHLNQAAPASPTIRTEKVRVAPLVARIAALGLSGVAATILEPRLWSLVERLDGLICHLSDFPDRIDAATRVLPDTDGALLRILAAGHFVNKGERLQALTLLSEALDDLPAHNPQRRDLHLLAASLQLDLNQPRLAAKTVLGDLSGLTAGGEKALNSLTGGDGTDGAADHGHAVLLAYLKSNPLMPVDRRSLLVEIGTTREDVPGQGSTRVLGQFCAWSGCDFFTVDMDPRNSRHANRMFDRLGLSARAVTARGQDWLAAFDGIIDAVFVDAYDFDHGKHSEIRQARYERFLGGRIDEAECHQMHLDCAQSLIHLLAPDGIICIDDTWLDDAGKWTAKGTTAMPFLLENGFEVIEARNRAALLRRRV
ncbi:MAG: hypothetical protein H7245_01315 [Candidatus Saccharibacteria bacterium]|nr:hypothetical protein [Pseudorhodobacter sp.]